MILVVNTGSSSLKARLYSTGSFEVLKDFSQANLETGGKAHAIAAKKLLTEMSAFKNEIKMIAHRVVCGGKSAKDGEIINDLVLNRIKQNSAIAPLHNPAAYSVIIIFKKFWADIKNYAVYDTSYYSDLLESESIYPINRNIAKKFDIRRIGYHGISHRFAFENSCAKMYKKVISIHLGAGCSVTAIHDGRAIATSMGMTPLGGVAMQTRCGDLDPGIVLLMCKKLGIKRTRSILENESGLKGLCPKTGGDMLRVLDMAGYKIESENYQKRNENSTELQNEAKEAIEVYCQRIRDFIGSYAAKMNGVECLVFTGKIGSGSSAIREKITYGLDYLGLKEVISIEPDEELAIARLVYNNN